MNFLPPSVDVLRDKVRHAPQLYGFCGKLIVTITSFFIFSLGSKAQTVEPATLNISGSSVKFGNYQFEWSVGEAVAINYSSNGNLVVSAGVLQPFAANQPANIGPGGWLPGEITIYPVPTKDVLEINIHHKLSGKNRLELFDAQGRLVMQSEFSYYGTGRTEKWDLSKLPSGQYFLNILQISPVTGRPVKKGAFKIQKIK